MTDPIADMFTQIRNAYRVSKEMVEIPFSQIKFAIGKILEKEKFIKSVELRGRRNRKVIEIALQYSNKTPTISTIMRISKPGQRIYASASQFKKLKHGMGILLVSTSKGVLTDREARKLNVGGEIIGEIS